MSQPVKLQIPQPCHESWAQMKPQEQGRFCASCAKTVVDFSNMSDRQLFEYFKNYTGGTCGKFSNDQLNRNIKSEKPQLTGWFKYIMSILFPAMLFANRPVAQGRVKNKSCTTKQNIADTNNIMLGMIARPPQKPKPVKEDTYVMGDTTVPIKLSEIALVDTTLPEPVFTVDSVVLADTLKLNDEAFTTVGYTVQVESTPQKSIFQNFIDSFKRTEPPFIVYPNPAALGALIRVTLQVKGLHYIQVMSTNGMVVQEIKIDAQAPNTTTAFNLSRNALPGFYSLLLIDDKRKKIGVRKLVVQ